MGKNKHKERMEYFKSQGIKVITEKTAEKEVLVCKETNPEALNLKPPTRYRLGELLDHKNSKVVRLAKGIFKLLSRGD